MKKKKAPPAEKPVTNKIRSVKTNDGKQYKIQDSLLIRYSALCKGIIEQDKNDEEIYLPDTDSESFDYVFEFIQLHRQKQPTKIHYPLRTNQNIRLIMEEADAELIERIISKGDNLTKKVLDASQYVEMQDFKKRIIVGIALKFIGSTVEELKQQYNIEDIEDFNEDEMRGQIKSKIQILSKIEDE